MATAKRAPKATGMKTRAFNKAVSSEKKFNSTMNTLYNSKAWSRTEKVAQGALKRITPYKDSKKYEKLWWDYNDIYRKLKGIWKSF